MGAYKVSLFFELERSGQYLIFETKRDSPACLYRKSTVCPSVSDASDCSSQVPLHRSWAPAKKIAIPRDRRDAVKTKQECEPNETVFSLGDWNAGKEDDSLPGPNFDVPRDLFRGNAKSEKRERLVHSYVILSHGAVRSSGSGPTDFGA